MSSDRLLEYEQENYDVLVENFLELHSEKWNEYVHEQWVDYEASTADYLYDMHRDREIEDGIDKS